MKKPQKTKCVKHILEFYIGNGKGVTTTDPNPMQSDVDALHQGTAVRVRSYRIYS